MKQAKPSFTFVFLRGIKSVSQVLALLYVCSVLPVSAEQLSDYVGDADRGRLVFAQCRTCHYPEPSIGHHNGPSLHAIFGKTAGKQEGFDDYSATFKQADFAWTPELLFLWLADVEAMFPETTMMSLGVPDPQQRADLVEYLKQFQ